MSVCPSCEEVFPEERVPPHDCLANVDKLAAKTLREAERLVEAEGIEDRLREIQLHMSRLQFEAVCKALREQGDDVLAAGLEKQVK